MVHYDGSYKNDTLDIQVQQYNIIMDILGGWLRILEEGLQKLLGKKDKRCARKHAEVCSVKYVEYCRDV